MYYNYHAKIRKLMTEGKLLGADILDERKGISPVMILYFEDGVIKPVREHKFSEYFVLIEHLYPAIAIKDLRESSYGNS